MLTIQGGGTGPGGLADIISRGSLLSACSGQFADLKSCFCRICIVRKSCVTKKEDYRHMLM